MNPHNKTQLTHTRIICALTYSSYGSPLSKNLKFGILVTNDSNSLTQRRIPHSHIIVHQFKDPESIVMLTLTKMKTIHDFTHGFAYIFQSTLVSTHSILKRVFKACNSDECIGTII